MSSQRYTICLCGDVMTGRGVDQILPHPSEPRLHEPSLRDAREYVWLAELANGPIPQPAPFTWPWGAALVELERRAPHARVINLETSVTRSANPWRNKDIHYRMHPGNVACLSAAGVDVCVLANNHAMDYGRAGLVETLDVLRDAGIGVAGAGRTLAEARAPAIVPLPFGRRLLVFAFGSPTSGVPDDWEATGERPGVDVLRSLSDATARAIVERIRRTRRPGDLVIASIHWGSNWGWEVEPEQVRFAHHLVDGGVDLVHGHSSHHPRPLEVYDGRLILYGCGDLINDYEGISGEERYRSELRLLYFAELSASTGALETVELVPLRARRMTLEEATAEERAWVASMLERAGEPFGTRVRPVDGALRLEREVARPTQPIVREEEVAHMATREWGHCRHCRFFGSPARMPLDGEEASCEHPTLSQFQLRVFGASGCNGYELRPGLTEREQAEEQPGLVT
jgi:poly-gamma-glutamate synthesis protein (capsule biosynthesis protein)